MSDQYVKLNLELMEDMAAAKATFNEVRVLLVISRKTAGYGREYAPISGSLFETMTGIDESNVKKVIKRLVGKGVVLEKKDGPIKEYAINKDSTQWVWDKVTKQRRPVVPAKKVMDFEGLPKWEAHFRRYFSLFDGINTIQTFDDSTAHRKHLAKIFHFEGKDLADDFVWELITLNDAGAGIFMCVNEGDGEGRLKENIKKVRAVFVDLDGAPLKPVLDFNPSLVVESSPGKYHAYWFTCDVPLAAFGTMQRNIATMFNGDLRCIDLPRVLRVPGFMHRKGLQFESKIISGSGVNYTYKDLVQMFPPQERQQFSGQKYIIHKEGANNEEFHGKYGFTEYRNANLIKRIGGMIAGNRTWDYIVDEAYKEGRNCEPPMDDIEIEKVLRNGRRYYEERNG
jgi:phage replication O-like protein O